MSIETRIIDPEVDGNAAGQAIALLGETLFRGQGVGEIYAKLFAAPNIVRVRGAFNESGQLRGVGSTMMVAREAILKYGR